MKVYKNLVNAIALTLQEIFQKNRYADKAIERLFKSNPQWGSRDRRFVAEAIYDIVRNYRLYATLAESPQNFWFMTGVWMFLRDIEIPEWPEFQHLNKKRILDLKARAEKEPAVLHSFPDWLWQTGQQELGKETWEREAEFLNNQAAVFLRANTLKTSPKELHEKLIADGMETVLLGEPKHGLQLQKRENVFQNRWFKDGLFEVQDAGSQLISEFLDPKPGDVVFDACAGAGGKSLHLAALMKNKGKVVAMDVESWKLDELKKRAKRAGAFNIETRLIDENTVTANKEKADKILMDVPCSGVGVLKRNPDTKWKLNAEVFERTKELQYTILRNYPAMLKKGGKMVYSTCSIFPSENNEQVKRFLQENPGYTLVAEQSILPSSGFDGFYMAMIEKTA